MHLVFVYGTLRHKLRKIHDRYPKLPWGKLYREGTIKGILFQLTPTVPGVIFIGENKVVGEMLILDKATLKLYDELEGHPYNYKRQLVQVMGTTVTGAEFFGGEAWVYEYPNWDPKREPIVVSGDWEQNYRTAVEELLPAKGLDKGGVL